MASKILVIDDDPGIVDAVELILTDEGYEVSTGYSPSCLDELHSDNLPHLILLDYLLSGVDGRNVLQRLRSQKMTRDIPVIIFSAHPDAEQAAAAIGANGFVGKPFEIDALLNAIQKNMRMRQ